MALSEVHAFTASYDKLVLRLLSAAKVMFNGKRIDVTAQWDTGASCTAISHEVVKALQLIPQGKRTIKTPSSTKEVNTYLVDIVLPNNVRVHNVDVCDSDIGEQGIGMLIGMNIISLGDFAVSNYENKTNYSFRIPSQKAVDYRAAATIANNIAKSHGKPKKR